MIPLLLSSAHAAEPEPVVEIHCARPVAFATPYAWAFSAERTPIYDGTLLVVRAPEDLLAPRNVGQRVLYVEGWPVEVLTVTGDLALILAPIVVPAPARVYFGDTTLPERVDAAARRQSLDRAIAIEPRAPGRNDGEVLATGRKHLKASVASWVRECGG